MIDGPDEWCNDEAIATDLGYRWDGVHVYKPGANLDLHQSPPSSSNSPPPESGNLVRAGTDPA